MDNKDNKNLENNIEENKDNEVKEPKEPLSERIDDKIDEIVGGAYDFIYGEKKDPNRDIPATMPDPDNEIRHINKVQTRRNILNRIGRGRVIKILLIILAIGLTYLLINALLAKLLGA